MTADCNGYIRVYRPSHPRAMSDGYIYEHILAAEEKMRFPLPNNSVVHHIDGNRANNAQDNLLVCKNIAAHNTAHKEERALLHFGNERALKCKFCGCYDLPENLYVPPKGSPHHRHCFNGYYKKYLIIKAHNHRSHLTGNSPGK